MPGLHVRRGDQVLVLAGKSAGHRGRVTRVEVAKRRAVVEGANMVRRHVKPGPKVMQGGIVSQEAPIPVSRLMVICGKCGAPTRVGHRRLEDGRIVRTCRRCGEVIER